jgi:glucose-6-phosphate 1-epimerase
VIFPQFAGRGPLPKHGVARNRGWQVTAGPVPPTADSARAAVWQAVLTDDDATRAIWPHHFELTLTARAEGDRLDTVLSVRNTDEVEWTFTAALHSYLALGDPEAQLHGLGGRTAEDNAADGKPITLGEAGQPLRATTARDIAVLGADQPLTLADPVLGPLAITGAGFGDRVVWNPGPGHGLSDAPDGDEQHFVCVEAAELAGVSLPPGAVWTGRQTLSSGAR